MAMSCGGGEGGMPTLRAGATFGLVGEPVAPAGGGTLPLIGARLQPDWKEPNVRFYVNRTNMLKKSRQPAFFPAQGDFR